MGFCIDLLSCAIQIQALIVLIAHAVTLTPHFMCAVTITRNGHALMLFFLLILAFSFSRSLSLSRTLALSSTFLLSLASPSVPSPFFLYFFCISLSLSLSLPLLFWLPPSALVASPSSKWQVVLCFSCGQCCRLKIQ